MSITIYHRGKGSRAPFYARIREDGKTIAHVSTGQRTKGTAQRWAAEHWPALLSTDDLPGFAPRCRAAGGPKSTPTVAAPDNPLRRARQYPGPRVRHRRIRADQC